MYQNEPSGVVEDFECWLEEAKRSGGPSKSCRFGSNQT